MLIGRCEVDVALSLIVCVVLCHHVHAEDSIQDVNAENNLYHVYRSWSIVVGVFVVMTFIAIILLLVFYFRSNVTKTGEANVMKNKRLTKRSQRMVPPDFRTRAQNREDRYGDRYNQLRNLRPPAHVDYHFDNRSTSILAPDRVTDYAYGSGSPVHNNGLPPSTRLVEIDEMDEPHLEPVMSGGPPAFHWKVGLTESTVSYNPLAEMAPPQRMHLGYF
ncbi:uncharacterized protein LOC121406837 [Lytechinus variegatus]|uniref:uncharacterized protein LOC121406837 n=1 Tax=Lytechinus variegatus TaxID=7654 RepID=UPI001BB25ED6|nr:uncharacterized protein LOC121406837 [Lytechinus variegatus]